MSVDVRSLQAAVVTRSSQETSQTVRIESHSFPSWRVRISVRNLFIGKKPQKWTSVQLIASDTSKRRLPERQQLRS